MWNSKCKIFLHNWLLQSSWQRPFDLIKFYWKKRINWVGDRSRCANVLICQFADNDTCFKSCSDKNKPIVRARFGQNWTKLDKIGQFCFIGSAGLPNFWYINSCSLGKSSPPGSGMFSCCSLRFKVRALMPYSMAICCLVFASFCIFFMGWGFRENNMNLNRSTKLKYFVVIWKNFDA